MRDKYLPIGTVVLLKGGEKKVMITSYLIFSNGDDSEKKMYDYGGCAFPEGIIESNYAVGFNHDQIEKVIHIGYVNDEQKGLNDILCETADEIRQKFESGELQ